MSAANLLESDVVDLFCGGGGTSAGMERALGRPVTVAVNHWDTAIAVHQANHPATRHHHCDVWNVAPTWAVDGRPVSVLWASPDCTSHSVARGGKPRQQKLRTLPWAVVRWAAAVRPEVMFVENVPEFRKWGPLGADGKPIKARAGETFRAWCRKLERLGYAVDHRVLCAADYGVPTKRKRLIVVARRDGLPICWPEPTHGSPGSCAANPRLRPFRTAAECIDFSIPCKSIFERKRPLAPKTMWRIFEGIRRFVLEHPRPFIIRTDMHQSNSGCVYETGEPLTTITSARGHALVVPSIVGVGGRAGQSDPTPGDAPLGSITGKNDRALVAPTLLKVNHGKNEARGEPANEPLSTVTAGRRGHALVTPVLFAIDQGGSGSTAQAAAEPLHTLVAKNRSGLVAALLTKHYGGVVGVPLDGRPLDTVTGTDHHALTAAALVKFRGTDGQLPAASPADPLPTISAGGNHVGLVELDLLQGGAGARDHVADVRAFLTTYYGSDATSGQQLLEPMRTITAKARLGLVLVKGEGDEEGEWYQVVDIAMRMLEPEELKRATCGPEFDIDLSAALTKEDQVKLVGNMVPPGLARAVVAVNHPASMRRAA